MHVQFNEYLKSCRENLALTQEELVQKLYSFDIISFESLEASTLSKWERGLIQPKLGKQVSIIQYFQTVTGLALPCWQHYSADEAEEMICTIGMHNLLGKSKTLVLNFPSNTLQTDDLSIYHLRNSEMVDKVLDINMDLDKNFNHDSTGLTSEQLKTWALHPTNSFFVCKYLDQFFGLLFTVRLKQEIFSKMMNCEMVEKELTINDFASFHEVGSNYIFSFFAMNEKAASVLFIHYYAHLIANQRVIKEVGIATMMEDAKKLIESMHLKFYKSILLDKNMTLQTYRETLPNFLTSEKVVKMILSKQDCPQE